MLSKREYLRFKIILKLKTIHWRTHRNKTKKPCLRELLISVSTLVRSQRQKNSLKLLVELLSGDKKCKLRAVFSSSHLCLTPFNWLI